MKYLSPFNSRYGITPPSGHSFTNLEKEFKNLFGSLPSLFDLGSEWIPEAGCRSLSPRWYENDDSFVVQIELPGIEPQDVSLEVGDNALRLSAARKTRSSKDDSKSTLAYKQSFSIPDGVDTDKVEAGYEDGVLSVTFPKTEVLKPRQIKIS
jgi:HSP20 family protein